MKWICGVCVVGFLLIQCTQPAPEVCSCTESEAEVASLKEQLGTCNSELSTTKDEADKVGPEFHHTCTMNGFGSGTCKFTNIGKGAGALCGFLRLRLKDEVVASLIERPLKSILVESELHGRKMSPVEEEQERAKLFKAAAKHHSNEILCSGILEPSTTKNVAFSIPVVKELCSAGGSDYGWNTVCILEFVPKSVETKQ
jgi:hypothetical protein